MSAARSGPTPARWGTEVSFRLGPQTIAEAREIAAELRAAARGCDRHVLFLDEDAGEYGCLAEWRHLEDAVAFAERPETVAALARLEARTGKAPRVRRYAMEEGSLIEPGAYHREHAEADAGRHGRGPDRPGAR